MEAGTRSRCRGVGTCISILPVSSAPPASLQLRLGHEARPTGQGAGSHTVWRAAGEVGKGGGRAVPGSGQTAKLLRLTRAVQWEFACKLDTLAPSARSHLL